ncbi:class I SAM-dependent methyltransferase [Vibrio sagamiensis]|uniref:O-methyltransferase n=1 Tax=Vibrio sagamiensis NBRC 104589 TaxID=1219064 RepID=A0A511QHS8_9VIBR|nr:class I SAM-dependent methyltransferase [Vibrio sagamiensis]PNQ65507.1 class I SAM-dependent methyltransferase [Vibrio agarivorans]GEM76864.1 O-methyltransferase [Vibrio sagamiensis NBRC 104589]
MSLHQVPSHLLKPLLLRSRESLVDNGLVYDPIAAKACFHCEMAADCLHGDVEQKQLLHATLTKLCDQRVNQFLQQNPYGLIINVGAGLDTRFYRLDNGCCHWIELDISEHLLWRQRLFHRNERYEHYCGSTHDMSWLERLPHSVNVPVLILCETALLDCTQPQVIEFIQVLSRHFTSAELCMVLAGDLTESKLGQKLGSDRYAHGLERPTKQLLTWFPWVQWIHALSPIDSCCLRWKMWQRWLKKIPLLKYRLTPVLVHIKW